MPYNDRLFVLLRELEPEELAALWAGALKCKLSDHDFVNLPKEARVALVSEVWRAAHGHTLMNMSRTAHEMPWKRILIDVADKLQPGMRWSAFKLEDHNTEEQIEAHILEMWDTRIRTWWDGLKHEQREKLALDLGQQLHASSRSIQHECVRQLTAASLAQGIAAGLLTGGGALLLAQGSTAALAGSLLGAGVIQQMGFWLSAQMLGTFAGARFALGGGASLVGGAVVALPATVAMVSHAVMSTSYRKSVPATVMLLSAVALHKQLSELE